MTGRPTTASVRPGTSVGGGGGLNSAAMGDYDEEYDEEEYESEDDGDVFAFVPRE